MRHLAWLGVLALSLMMAVPAFADVRNAPLRVEWVGPLPDLAGGKTFTGTLRFVSSTPVEITNVRFSGAAWKTALAGKSGHLVFTSRGAQDVQFQASTADAKQPLVLQWEANGVTMSETIDFAAASARTHGTTRAVAAGTEGPRTASSAAPKSAEPIDSFEGLEVRSPENFAAPKAAAPNTVHQVTSRNIRVHGRFVYYRSDAATIGVDGMSVRIMDGGTQLAITPTDWAGNYDVTFYWDPCALFCHSNPDIHVEFVCANTQVNVRTTGVFGGTYSWSSGTTSGYTGSDLNEGTQTPSDETQDPALEILTDVTRDWRWYQNYQSVSMPAITMYWPDGATGAYYSSDEIHVGTDRSWREDTHAHEYGHHFIAHFGNSLSPDYCNGICDSGSCGHCMWCQETDHDAWAEGWPNWIAHVQTVSYATDYGIAALNVRDQEALQFCSSSLDNPYKTEGFLGALLQDIWDSANEHDPAISGSWSDKLSLGTSQIFTVTTVDKPTTPLAFINAFNARYPSLHENLWETCMNNDYDMDAAAPAAVTNLTSPSHALFSSSPDPTVDFTWTRATDDWSGSSGYSVRIGASAALPSAVQNVGDVTSWTSGILTPGTYYMTIRTRDRDGRWSASYATYGPFTIRLPEPANLTAYLPAGWARDVVPRGAADGTAGSVPNPSSLTGDATSTYWNTAGINSGETATSTGFNCRAYLDEASKYVFYWNPIGAGGWFYGNNGGPFYVPAGRHTLETRYDASDAIAETNESDNRWGHQWVWTPPVMTPNTNLVRSAPPVTDAGWDAIVDGSTLYTNLDGVRMNTSISGSWWHAVYVVPTDLTQDYDALLYFPTASADTGFTTSRGYSGAGAGYLDAVMVNRNMVSSPATWDVGIRNWSGGSSSYTTRQVTSSVMTFGDSTNLSMAAGEMMMLREFYLPPASVGAVSITARIVSGTGPVYLQYRNSSFTLGGLYNYTAVATTPDSLTTARIDTQIASAGWEGICLYRNPKDGSGAVTVVLEISTTPPDFKPVAATGWYSPFVPRPASDGTQSSVPLPDTLVGNTASTYLNFAVMNDSPTAASGLLGQVFLDGVYSWWLAYGTFPGSTTSLFNWGSPWTVRGGRHTLSVWYDAANVIEEKYEDNNLYGEQFVWSPQALSLAAPVTRTAPPDKVGGWTHVTTGEVLYYDVDGLRLPSMPVAGANNYWGAVAVMPGASSDVDVRFHELAPGTKNGFGAATTISGWGTGQSDYCIGNFNTTTRRAIDAGVIDWSGSESYTAEAVGSQYLATNPSGMYGPFTLGAGHLLNLHEVYFNVGTYAVDLFNASGSVDWGVSVHGTTPSFQSKSTTVSGGISYASPAGGNELLTCTIPVAGYYCVGVWKAGSADLPLAGTYTLQFRSLVADAPAAGTEGTALAAVSPNPLATGARVSFTLAKAGPVKLEVYDLHGARVRTLVNGPWNAGRSDLRWEGDDDAGRTVAPGVYFVRFAAGGVSNSRRVVKVE